MYTHMFLVQSQNTLVSAKFDPSETTPSQQPHPFLNIGDFNNTVIGFCFDIPRFEEPLND